MTKTTTKRKETSRLTSGRRARYLWMGVGGLVGLALIVWVAWAIAGETEIEESIAFAPVSVAGDGLPAVDLSNGDPAAGSTAPTISGTGLNGEQLSIAADGRPKLVILLAHWCSHCQREVPVIQEWIESGAVPDGVDVYAATVMTDRLRDSSTWPPEKWLGDLGWTVPTLEDDESGSIATAYGLTGTPFYVVLDGDNRNLGRISGAIGVDGLNALAALARNSMG